MAVSKLLTHSGGPEWNDRFCIPESQYGYVEEPPFKFWAINVDMSPNRPGGKTYCFKVASETLRLDTKAGLPDENSRQLVYIAQSTRTIEPDRAVK